MDSTSRRKREQPEYLLTLQALPDFRGDPIARLRAALKRFRRCFGLRCTSIREVGSTEPIPGVADGD